jgi:hypothetical protein
MKIVAALCFGMIGAALGTSASQAGEADRVPIYEVHEVTVRVMESYPEQLSITAKGTTRTGGWSDPRLRPASQPTRSGVYEFTFVARAPQGAATMAITAIAATYTMQKPRDFRAVRVRAETNSKVGK